MYGSVSRGAFFLPELRYFELGLLAVAILGLVTLRVRRSDLDAVVWSAVAILVWTAARGFQTTPHRPGFEQTALVLAVLATFLVARRLPAASADLVVHGVTCAATFVAATAVVGTAFHWYPLAIELSGRWRGSSTITYANATACVLVVVVVLVLGGERPPIPALSRLACVLLITGLASTMCRAAVPSLAVGVAAIAWRRPQPPFRVAPVLVGAAVALAGLAPSLADGDQAHPAPALVGMLVGSAIAALDLPRRHAGVRRLVGPVLVGTAGVLVVVGVAGRTVSRRIGDRGSMDARFDEWHLYWDLGVHHVVAGTGPHAFGVRFGPSFTAVYFAHNEYLQVFAELGIIGLVLVLLGMGAVLRSLWRRRGGRWSTGALAAALAYGVFLVGDFVWNVPVVPVVVAGILGVGASEGTASGAATRATVPSPSRADNEGGRA